MSKLDALEKQHAELEKKITPARILLKNSVPDPKSSYARNNDSKSPGSLNQTFTLRPIREQLFRAISMQRFFNRIARKEERTDALATVKKLRKEFGFTAGMLKGSLAEARQSNAKK